jgi:heptaprenyl diphosphate synthase
MPVSSDHKDRLEIVSFLGALCLFLSAVEYLIPKPLPFFRLGLANLPLLLGLRFLRPTDLLLVLLLKVLGQGLVNGTLASYVFLFSLAGSAASLATMSAVYRLGKTKVSLVGVSLSGALASSVVQVSLAVTFVFGPTARLIAPLSLGSGLATGLVIGLFAVRFVKVSRWLEALEVRYRGL